MYKGYIIFLTKNWLPIVDNLINSVLLFSIYDIEINCINFEYNFENSRIKSKTIQMPNNEFFNITKCKLISTINSEFDIALILDGDMIVTNNIDKIFEDNEDRILRCKFPLFAKHPHNPYTKYYHIISTITNKSPKMKWVYSNYLFTKNQKWFFEEALSIMNNIPENQYNFYYPVPEESILNALLSHYEIDYDLGYNYFPNGFKCVIDYFLHNNKEGEEHILTQYLQYDCPVKIYAFHGHDIKNIEYGKFVIEQIYNRRCKYENV